MEQKEQIKLSDHKIWSGEYKGIRFSIHQWNREFTPETEQFNHGYHWNYYIYVKARKMIMTKKFTVKATKTVIEPMVDYSKMYSDVSMHGGITFWNGHVQSRNGKREIDEIGCDYSHCFDYEESNFNKLKIYTVDEILVEVKETIDTLPKDLFF